MSHRYRHKFGILLFDASFYSMHTPRSSSIISRADLTRKLRHCIGQNYLYWNKKGILQHAARILQLAARFQIVARGVGISSLLLLLLLKEKKHISNPRVLSDMGLAIPRPIAPRFARSSWSESRLGDPRSALSSTCFSDIILTLSLWTKGSGVRISFGPLSRYVKLS